MTSFPPPPSWMASSKMTATEMTSGGRLDSREDILQTSAPPVMSHAVLTKGSKIRPVDISLYFYF